VVDELDAVARDRRITLDCDADGVGAWDEHRVFRAISNLASNAVQHSARATRNAESSAINAETSAGDTSYLVDHFLQS
jgi:signal transduction histidine kinase